jgi:hypothetical protein
VLTPCPEGLSGGDFSPESPYLRPYEKLGQPQTAHNLLILWWAVLGSNQWPLPCETGAGCLQINDMRAVSPIATGT